MKSKLIAFVPFLFIVTAWELYGTVLKFILHRPNGWLYNIATMIQFSFWIPLLTSYTKDVKTKKIGYGLLILFVTFSFLNLFFIQGIHSFNNYTLIAGALIDILICCIVLMGLLEKDTEQNILKAPAFWITSGSLFFFTGTFIYFSLYNRLYELQLQNNTNIFNLIILNLNILFYLCISIGLIVSPKSG